MGACVGVWVCKEEVRGRLKALRARREGRSAEGLRGLGARDAYAGTHVYFADAVANNDAAARMKREAARGILRMAEKIGAFAGRQLEVG